jgi:hypothetical protein
LRFALELDSRGEGGGMTDWDGEDLTDGDGEDLTDGGNAAGLDLGRLDVAALGGRGEHWRLMHCVCSPCLAACWP